MAREDLDFRSDIYALGVVIYEVVGFQMRQAPRLREDPLEIDSLDQLHAIPATTIVQSCS